MIKFFRHIRQNLIMENKTSIYLKYAIGEIVLVVVGILIALQINNWNELRKERKLEVVVLNDIKDNIIRNNILIDDAIKTIDEINVSADLLISYLTSDSIPDTIFNDHIDQASRSGTFLFRLNTDGYESLKSIGFTIIENEMLKDEILSLYEVTYGEILTRLNFANNLYDSGWWKDYLYKTEPNRIEPYDLQGLKKDKRFLTAINELYFIRNVFQSPIKESLIHSEKVLQLIEEELNKQNGLSKIENP